MIKKIIKICCFILIAVLQITLMPYLAINGVWPNLILITAILLLLFDFEQDAFYAAGIGGVILDLTSVLPMGLNTILMIGLIYLLKTIAKKYFPDTNAIIVFITVFTSSILFTLATFLFLNRPPHTLIFLEAFYGGVLAEIMYFAYYSKINKFLIVKIGDR